MDHSVHNKLVSFIWSIADDCLRDVYVRGKYRDVILPMVVLRRLDTLLEPTKQQVLDEVREQKEEQDFIELDALSLQHVSGYVFYNTSKWTLKSLFDTATNNQQILLPILKIIYGVLVTTLKKLLPVLIYKTKSVIWQTKMFCWMYWKNLYHLKSI
jgi:type I restriction enzyme M protein